MVGTPTLVPEPSTVIVSRFGGSDIFPGFVLGGRSFGWLLLLGL
jgi:hypothetical protein